MLRRRAGIGRVLIPVVQDILEKFHWRRLDQIECLFEPKTEKSNESLRQESHIQSQCLVLLIQLNNEWRRTLYEEHVDYPIEHDQCKQDR